MKSGTANGSSSTGTVGVPRREPELESVRRLALTSVLPETSANHVLKTVREWDTSVTLVQRLKTNEDHHTSFRVTVPSDYFDALSDPLRWDKSIAFKEFRRVPAKDQVAESAPQE